MKLLVWWEESKPPGLWLLGRNFGWMAGFVSSIGWLSAPFSHFGGFNFFNFKEAEVSSVSWLREVLSAHLLLTWLPLTDFPGPRLIIWLRVVVGSVSCEASLAEFLSALLLSQCCSPLFWLEIVAYFAWQFGGWLMSVCCQLFGGCLSAFSCYGRGAGSFTWFDRKAGLGGVQSVLFFPAFLLAVAACLGLGRLADVACAAAFLSCGVLFF